MRSTEAPIPANQAATPEVAPHGLRIESDTFPGGVLVARVRGEIDLLSAPELAAWAESARAGSTRLVLDLDGVGFLGSAGLSVLAELSGAADRDELRLAVVATSRTVLRPLEMTGVLTRLTVCSSVTGAVEAVAAAETKD
ncbi:STAS domain-containing protein [Saccharomonospora sp. NPDC006951]